MALSLSSPGISIKEVDLTTGSVNATSPLAAGLAAPFARGPVEEVVEIRTEKDLLNTFGPPSKENYHYEYWYSGSNFLSTSKSPSCDHSIANPSIALDICFLLSLSQTSNEFSYFV